jgi:hypothetical protein
MNANDPSLVRAIRGPITLITVGVLFALNNFTQYRFNQTWPVLLIVFGLLSLMRRGAVRVEQESRPGFPPYGFPPPPPPVTDRGTGGYRSSTYTAPPSQPSATESGPSKGGFGASAKPGDPPSGESA